MNITMKITIEMAIPHDNGVDILEGIKIIEIKPKDKPGRVLNGMRSFLTDALTSARSHKPKTIHELKKPEIILP